ncbi:DUF5615 family PIN-like protein [Hymenobacter bucti]|uniref:DUF5615 family PIN-like protein n=1 Tax=Hymenobacter bucti TaxID=1844114 RepID=A0ABW4QVW9_9BACT
MKLLLDEDLPSKLRYRLRPEHDAVSVQDMGWHGKKNGELLRLMETVGIQALLTGDKQMQQQQNWRSYPLPVLVFDTVGDQYDDYNALIPQVKELLARPGLAGGVHVVQA